MENENYYLGLDIGTDSVGYAATDSQYNLKKFHGEPVWGVHLFDAASLNTDRRAFRTARRRLNRRQQRVDLVQELFAKEVCAIDPRFFIRNQSSSLCESDRGEPFAIFSGNGITDKEYHKQYPTIHHLLVDLMWSTEKHDIRLVYIACAWLVAHRGHFLSDVSKDNVSELTDFNSIWDELITFFKDKDYSIPELESGRDVVAETLREKSGITYKVKRISVALYGGKAPAVSNDDEASFKVDPALMIKLLCGSKIKAKDLFANDEYEEVQSFSLGDDDAVLATVFAELSDDEVELITILKKVYDWALLVDIISGYPTISEAKVSIYERHKSDLAALKYIVKKYLGHDKYKEIFSSDGKTNYGAYINSKQSSNRANLEDFSKYILSQIKDITPEVSDEETLKNIKDALNARTFMPKQKNTDNRVIPYQLYAYELDKILENAERYYAFLSEKDADGLTISDKIKSVFEFKVPYFVGPLNPSSKYAWIVKKGEGKIYPWNFDKIVDLDASETEFIRKLTNHCTYLPSETVLPKDSLLYHKFTVLNEINNLKINGEPISVEVKQSIYNDVFLKYKTVTKKKIVDCLVKMNLYRKDIDVLSGIDDKIKSDLKPYHDFKRMLESGKLTEAQVEDIIERSTYSEDKSRLKKWLEVNYPDLPKEDIKYICNLNYKDFGRLSRTFLTGFEALNISSGVLVTVIAEMWDTNNNLMQLLSEDYTFVEKIQEEVKAYYLEKSMTLADRLNEMYVSNAVKRPVIRALDVTNDVVKAMKKAPKKIFVEMTRGGTPEEKGKRTKSRKDQILELYSQCGEDAKLLKKQIEDMGELADNKLQGDRLFLYYMQLGKCMYSGEPIDLTLLSGSTYNIDHIYPQALVKDDSVLNNQALVLSKLNGEKGDTYPINSDIRQKMSGFWMALRDKKLITEEKYKRLTRSTPFSDDEKWGFINRQLTETSQSTKAVTVLLKERYPDTEIVFVKARTVSDYRQAFELFKSRTFNDLHHAKDAYLNIVVGNVYNTRFTKKWFSKHNNDYSIKTKTLFGSKTLSNGDGIFWNGDASIALVKNIMSKNNAHVTKYAYCRKGGFFNQMPLSKGQDLIPLKKGKDTEIYGGYSGLSVSYFLLIKYKSGKKNEVMFYPVSILESVDLEKNSEKAGETIAAKLGLSVPVEFPLGMRKIKINTVLDFDGFRACLSGGSIKDGRMMFLPIMQLSEEPFWNNYCKRLERFVEKQQNNPKYRYDETYDFISHEVNIKFYDVLADKLNNTVYSKRPGSKELGGIITIKRDVFTSLSIVDQSKALVQLLLAVGRTAVPLDLELLTAAKKACMARTNLKLTNLKKDYSQVKIVDQSASGIWEQDSVNLLSLL